MAVRRKTIGLGVLLTLALASSLWAQLPAPAAAPAAGTAHGVDLDGHALDLTAFPDEFLVLVFVSSDCPVSERYLPEIDRLARVFAARRVRFWIVYPNPDETVAGVRQQSDVFQSHVTAVLDPEQSLTAFANPRVMPEAAVLLPLKGGVRHEAYRGRIDNRYEAFGEERPGATQHELESAIRAVLAGRAAKPAAGPAVGCTIRPAGIHLPPKSKQF